MSKGAGASAAAQAVELLSKLTPEDLVGDDEETVALRRAGVALFGRLAIKERYGERDVVEFLEQQAGHRRLLYRLERLQSKINADHEKRVQSSKGAGINKARKATMDAIEAACGSDDELDGDAGWQRTPGNSLKRPPLLEAPEPASAGDDEPMAADKAADDEAADAVDADAGREPTGSGLDALRQAASLPAGSFRRVCGVCKKAYEEVHHFYHRLCPKCAELNYAKRLQTAELHGKVALVTGGRVRIGYEIALRLLRAGAHVVSTTRFPSDAAARYASEADFETWRGRLEVVGPLELADVRQVEAFCGALVRRHPRIHILINNAAQTLTREAGWFVRMESLECKAAAALPPAGRSLLSASRGLLGPPTAAAAAGEAALLEAEGVDESAVAAAGAAFSAAAAAAGAAAPPQEPEQSTALVVSGGGGGGAVGAAQLSAAELAAFPAGRLDETLQPLDLSAANSWSRRLGQVPTTELLHTLAANAVAPFVLCSALRPALSPVLSARGSADGSADDSYGHIINVSALEGKFTVGKKGSGHPHTNMAKASLNMLTLTSAGGLFQDRILVNAVDTGWVTDMAPGGVGPVAATHATHVGPPLDAEDGAARVLDPIFSHEHEPEKWLVRGKFWKDYCVASW